MLPLRNQPAAVSLTAGQRKQIWDSLLDADMNSRYWRCLARRYYYYDLAFKVAVLCSTSGAVVSWLSVLELVWLAKLLSVVAACLSGSLLVLNFPARTEVMMDLAGKWTALMHAHENLWNVVDATPPDSVLTKYAELQTTEVELTRTESRLPFSRRLVEQASDEVRRSRGLSPGQPQRS
jgi:hypothetical protein